MSDPLALENPYDQLPYPRYAHSGTHPDHLYAIARLFGLAPAPVTACRVLELGCAGGANLLPLGFHFPDSRFLGIDLSAVQLAEGRERVAALGLRNVELRQASILDVDASWGRFDYVICHGVYSWVPEPVRERILAVCRENLEPQGIACVSYNVFPGWQEPSMLRQHLLLHDRRRPTRRSPLERVAEAQRLLSFLVDEVMTPADSRFAFLQAERARWAHCDEAYLFHEFLEPENQPFYVREFAERAARVGLRYFGDSCPETMLLANQPSVVAEFLQDCDDPVELQQHLDFFSNRRFRVTLLTHAEQRPSRRPQPERLEQLWLRTTCDIQLPVAGLFGGEPLRLESPEGEVVPVNDPALRAALWRLQQVAPRALHFEELLADVAELLAEAGLAARVVPGPALDATRAGLSRELVELYFTCFLDLHGWPPAVAGRLPERPVVSALVRLEAATGRSVTNPWHLNLFLEPFEQELLARLDGQRTVAELQHELQPFAAEARAVGARDAELAEEEEEDGAEGRGPHPRLAGGPSADEPLAVTLRRTLERFRSLGLLLG